MRHDGIVELHAVQAGAVNQTVKAMAIAHRLVEQPGEAPTKVVQGFVDVLVSGESRAGVRFVVER